MQWIFDYQLFLFDFDGLLVNTEHLHFQAYANMLRNRGVSLEWDFPTFLQNAHLESTGLKDSISAQYPKLFENETKWETLYEEKKSEYFNLLSSGKVELMQGAEALLTALDQANIQRVVVTNSLKEQTDSIKARIPVLKTIEHWVTREQYLKPKPDPECYLRAIELYGKKGDRIIGFEDSIKGLKALLKSPAQPVLVCPSHHPQLEVILEPHVVHYESLDQITKMHLL